jgi:hypothetical protein
VIIGVPVPRHECPLDGCGWTLDLATVPPSTGMSVMPVGASPEDQLSVALKDAAVNLAKAVEAALRAHFDTHDVVDFLRTIQRLRDELAGCAS